MKKIKLLLLSIALLVLLCIVPFILIADIFFCLHNFMYINGKLALFVSLGISVLLGALFFILILKSHQFQPESKIRFWIKDNYAKFCLGYIVLLLFITSIKGSTTWGADEINDILSIEWTIFGLSLTAFFVWEIVMLKYLREKQPISEKSDESAQKYQQLINKRVFSQEIEKTFGSIVLLTINLVLLVLSTALIYITQTAEQIFTQNIVRCTLYFSTNTILSLFIDIMKPLLEEKKKIKSENKVSIEDFNNAGKDACIQSIKNNGIIVIDSIESISEDIKEKVKEAFNKMVDDLFSKDYESKRDQ